MPNLAVAEIFAEACNKTMHFSLNSKLTEPAAVVP